MEDWSTNRLLPVLYAINNHNMPHFMYKALCLTFFACLFCLQVLLLALGPTKVEENRSLWPEDWDHIKEENLKSSVTIGMISTANYHHQIVGAAMASWWTEERREMVTVFSDSIKPQSASIPNFIDTKCANSYYIGIWCKNAAMIEEWKTNPRFKDTKWFVRIMDDSYLHLENLYHLVQQYDWTERVLLGDLYCTVENITYPSGGPGIIFSRGLLDDWNWDDWMAPLLEKDQDGDLFADDVIWGEYLLRRKVPITNHFGITQSPLDVGGQLMQYFLSFINTPWALPFRPVAIHCQHRSQQMRMLHKILHEIPYHREAKDMIALPECTCRPSSHQKCSWNHALVDAEVCRWASQSLNCLGPGPWPNLKPEYWHDEDMCA